MANSRKTASKKRIRISDLSSRKEKLSRRKKLKKPVYWLGLESSDRVVLVPIKVNLQRQAFRLAVSNAGTPTPTPSPTPTPTGERIPGGKYTMNDNDEVVDDTPPPSPSPTPTDEYQSP